MHGHRSSWRRETGALPAESHRPCPWLVRPGLDDLCGAFHQLRHPGIVRVHLRRPGVPAGPVADVGGDRGDPGVLPCRRLHRAYRHDPAGGRRLRLADADPGQRHRLRLCCHRLVVHPLAVGAHLRQHPRDPVLRAAVGDAREPVRRRLVRHEQRDFRRHPDHDRAGGRAGLDRDGRVRPPPEVGLLRRPDRVRGHRGAAAVQQPRELHRLVQPRGAEAVRREPRLPGHQRRGAQGRVPRPLAGFRPARPDAAAGAGDDVLHPVAELGRQPVRRDPRRQ